MGSIDGLEVIPRVVSFRRPHPSGNVSVYCVLSLSVPVVQEPICVRATFLFYVAEADIPTSRAMLNMSCVRGNRRGQCLTDALRNPLPPSQQTPRAGAHLLIYPVHIPPSFEPPKIFPASSAFEVITTLDPENFRCAWKNVERSSWILDAERWQALVEVVEDGRKKTRYDTIEVFGGLLAYPIRFFLGSGLQDAFTAMAQGLKTRSEEKNSQRS
jgi:hypothetical protein